MYIYYIKYICICIYIYIYIYKRMIPEGNPPPGYRC